MAVSGVEGKIERNVGTVEMEGHVEEAEYTHNSYEDGYGYIQDNEQQVEEAMQRLPLDVPIEDRPIDIQDSQSLTLFMANGCSCSKFGGKPCSTQFTLEHVQTVRLSCKDLERKLVANSNFL